MNALQLSVGGMWAHFKRPETSNNPLTYSLITKTALVGIVGAVLGIDRKEMGPLFPQLCQDLLYGVELLSVVSKRSWGFTSRKALYPTSCDPKHMRPVYFEFLKKPHFRVLLALGNPRSASYFYEFSESLQNSEAIYTPVLGWHNCPANLLFESAGYVSEKQHGRFDAKSFVSSRHRIEETGKEIHMGLERIPVYQDNFWSRPQYDFQDIVVPLGGVSISAFGDYFQYLNGECWWLT